jgi:hypothetical protein
MLEYFPTAEWLAASEEGLSYMEVIMDVKLCLSYEGKNIYLRMLEKRCEENIWTYEG